MIGASLGFFEVFAAALAGLFEFVQSYGISIVLLTLVVRLLLLPLSIKQSRSAREMQRLQPELKKIQTKYKGNRQKMNEEVMALYKEHGANPFGGCLPLVAQMPVFIALFYVIRKPLAYLGATTGLAEALHAALRNGVPGVNHFLLWRLDCTPTEVFQGTTSTFGVPCSQSSPLIAVAPYVVLLLLMGATTYFQQRQLMATRSPTDPTARQMQAIMKIMPVMIVVFAINFPAGVVLYWITTNLWTIGQQKWIFRKLPPAAPPPAKSTPPSKGKGKPVTKPGAKKSSPGGRPKSAEASRASKSTTNQPRAAGAKKRRKR
ncbi:hypothetical protein BH18ACT15_BH18ACT15_14940 [soil metagenome]